MKIKIVVIDDEKNIRDVLKKLLVLFDRNYEIVGEAASIKEAKKVIEETAPNIVLLDIRLEDGSGFELINQLETVDFKLIFITAYNQYAIKAFKFNAMDYLMKPIDPDEFRAALNKAQETISENHKIKEIVASFKENEEFEAKKIVIRTTTETHFIKINGIQYCHSQGAYTSIITDNGTFLASKNLKHFQDLLAEYNFIRSHQSYMVNREWVTSIKGDNLVLRNDVLIPISSRKKAEIKSILSKNI